MTAQRWSHACFLGYFYFVCLVYGFGSLIVATSTAREAALHADALEALRVEHLSSVFIAWGPDNGSRTDQLLARDIALSVKEVCTLTWPCSSSTRRSAAAELP